MNLSIIIVSWNVRDLLKSCLESIFYNAPQPPLTLRGGVTFEVFVVDNNSQDGTSEMAQKEFPQVRLIVNEKNLGFAKANNQALCSLCHSEDPPAGGDEKSPTNVGTHAREIPHFVRNDNLSDCILLLNPDMRVLPGTLQGMVDFMQQHPEAGVAGCHLINEKGETIPHIRRFPTVWNQIAILLKLPHLFPDILNKYLMKDFDYDKEASVDSIRGSFFMLRREVLEKVGLLDERFFVWFEEVDFCQRVIQAGYKVMYAPSVKCLDYVGQSFKQMPLYQKQEIFTQSMLKYFQKWKPQWQYWLLWLLRPVGLGMAWTMGIVNSKFKNQKAK